jgi:outer membrane beta-barrel protein
VSCGAKFCLAATTNSGNRQSEKVETNVLKKKFLDDSNEPEKLQIVQNRQNSKKGKLIVGAFLSPVVHDLFATTLGFGGSLGFGISEVFVIEALYAGFSDEYSSAESYLESQGATLSTSDSNKVLRANVNFYNSLVGGQLLASLLYGKLSFLGLYILHFDLFALAGAGMLKTTAKSDNPNYPSSTKTDSTIVPWLGVGALFYLTHSLVFRIDYKLWFYNENIYQAADQLSSGGSRSVTTNQFNFGAEFLLF